MDSQKNTAKKVLARSLAAGLLAFALLAPSAASAMMYGPFQAYGGQILFNTRIIMIPYEILVINEKLDGSTSMVSNTGSLAVGYCFPGFWVLGFGIVAGPIIQNIFGLCLPVRVQ